MPDERTTTAIPGKTKTGAARGLVGGLGHVSATRPGAAAACDDILAGTEPAVKAQNGNVDDGFSNP